MKAESDADASVASPSSPVPAKIPKNKFKQLRQLEAKIRRDLEKLDRAMTAMKLQ